MEKEIAKHVKSNPKIFWKYANSKRKTNTGISELKFKSEEGEERKTTTDKEKAEVWLVSSVAYSQLNQREIYH